MIPAATDASAIPATMKKTCREFRPVIGAPNGLVDGLAIACFPKCLNRGFIPVNPRFPGRQAGHSPPTIAGLRMTGALKLIKIAPHFTLTLPIQRRSQSPVLAGCGFASRFLSLPTRMAVAPLAPSEPPD